jgi:hypothetical protein
LINGFERHLKDDGTYNKFSVEYVNFEKKKEKEEYENQDVHESESEDSHIHEKDGEQIKTFICNEK